MPRPREQVGQVTVRVEDLPRPLDTRGSIRVLQMSERIEVEERYVTRLLQEIEDLERSRGG
ncbi:MAG: hypothetical protein QW756_02080 [Nitrososphaerota archaeon]